jgi:N-acetylglucosamine-6-sulfatase
MPSSLHESRSMPSSPSTGSVRSRGSLALLAVLVLGLAVTLVAMRLSPTRSTPRSPASMPAGKVTAAPAELVPVGSPPPKQSRRPNIITILADDMRTDDLRWMPDVRRLIADRGLTFRNSFSPYPLCCPARASLMSGQYAHNHHVFSHVPPYGFEAFDDSATLGTSLNAAGYNTIALGKYLNGYGDQRSKVTGKPSFRYVPAGWTEWRAAVTRPPRSGYTSGGTYNYWHTLFNVDGHIDDRHKGQYQTAVLGRMAARMIEKYHRSPKPFFMYFSPVAPHFGSPREADDPRGIINPANGKVEQIKTPARPRWVRGRFDRQIPRASGLPKDGGPSEADVRDKPRPMRDLPELSPQERIAVRTLTRQRAEALYVLDRQVGNLVATLKRTGEYDNTIIMFTSDNGYFLGEHRMRQGKIKPQEPSLRVPFLVSGPGIPHGQRFDPVTTPGVTATILQIAGARPPHPADGVSVVPSFTADRGWRVPVVTEGLETSQVFRNAESHRAPGFTDVRTTIGIRTAQWKLVRYNDGDGELYDLDTDPNELTSRYGDPRYARVQGELQRLWATYKDCRGTSCRAPMPVSLQRDPAQERASTDRQSRGVDARYGYWR